MRGGTHISGGGGAYALIVVKHSSTLCLDKTVLTIFLNTAAVLSKQHHAKLLHGSSAKYKGEYKSIVSVRDAAWACCPHPEICIRLIQIRGA